MCVVNFILTGNIRNHKNIKVALKIHIRFSMLNLCKLLNSIVKYVKRGHQSDGPKPAAARSWTTKEPKFSDKIKDFWIQEQKDEAEKAEEIRA